MQRKVTNLLIALAVMSLIAGVASAQAPSTMMYQGRLTTATGAPIQTATDVTFTIYDDPTAGSALWAETISGLTPDANGVFTVELGGTSPLTAAVFNGAERYLGIQVASDAEMTPRQPLNSAPYSVNSGNLPGVASSALGTIFLAQGLSPAMTDIGSVSITVPGFGYVHVVGNATFGAGGTTGQNYIVYQIRSTPGGDYDGSIYQIGGKQSYGTTGSHYEAMYVDRYFAVAPGTYTFYFQGLAWSANGAGASSLVFNPRLTAKYYPTAYGGVSTVAAETGSSGSDEPQLNSSTSQQSASPSSFLRPSNHDNGNGPEVDTGSNPQSRGPNR
jgi:hypothetical protein